MTERLPMEVLEKFCTNCGKNCDKCKIYQTAVIMIEVQRAKENQN